MVDKPSSIRNLGPKSDALYAKAGIFSADQIIKLGADETYFRLLQSGSRPHFIAYYALVMGLQGRPWTDCTGAEKTTLRVKFDTLITRVPQESSKPSDMEKQLDALGVRNLT